MVIEYPPRTSYCEICRASVTYDAWNQGGTYPCELGWLHISVHEPKGGHGMWLCPLCVNKASMKEIKDITHDLVCKWYQAREEIDMTKFVI